MLCVYRYKTKLVLSFVRGGELFKYRKFDILYFSRTIDQNWNRWRKILVSRMIISHQFPSSINPKDNYLPRVQNNLKEHQLYFSVLLSRMKKFLLTRKILFFVFLSIIVKICNTNLLLRHTTIQKEKQKTKKQDSPSFFFRLFREKKKIVRCCFFLIKVYITTNY